MKNGEEVSGRAPDSDSESSQPPTSYVYPVKSLLTGIQPAPPSHSRPSIPRRNSSQSVGLAALQDLLTHQLTGARMKPADGPDHSTSSRSHSMFYPYPSRTPISSPFDKSQDHPRTTSNLFPPVVQPIDRQSSLPISFVEAALPPTSTHPSISASSISFSPPERDLPAPNGSPSDITTPPPQYSEDDAPTLFGSKPLRGLTEHLLNGPSRSSPTHSVNSHLSHMSQSGIVHLPPSSSASASSRAGSRGSGSHTHNSSRKYFPSSKSNNSSRKVDRVPEAQEGREPDDSSSPLNSDLKSLESNMQGESEPAGDFVTTKYCYEMDESGNHLVIGREGEIRRCEDEVRIS